MKRILFSLTMAVALAVPVIAIETKPSFADQSPARTKGGRTYKVPCHAYIGNWVNAPSEMCSIFG